MKWLRRSVALPLGCVALAMSFAMIASGEPATGYVSVGTTSTGVVYWYGHPLAPPYTFSVGFRVDPETTWTGIFVNGLPFQLHEKRPRNLDSLMKANGIPEGARSAEFMRAATTRARERTVRDSTVNYFGALATELRTRPDLVDSVVTPSDSEIRIHWKGRTRPENIRLGSAPFPRPDPFAMMSREARSQLQSVSGGRPLLVSRGLASLSTGSLPELLAQVDSLRAGYRLTRPIISPHFLEELSAPEPMDSLLARR